MMPIFGLNCYPTVIFYRDGKEFARYEGYESDEHFREFLRGIK
jgi:thioredoxin-like negative regulator of GroEL